MQRTVAQKMGVREGVRSYITNAPATAIQGMNLPDLDLDETLRGQFWYMHLFVLTQAEMADAFPRTKEHLGAPGMLWISWPKGGCPYVLCQAAWGSFSS
ncbi:hypothetical protein GCM10027402_03330 [Arthrobacter monumenti]